MYRVFRYTEIPKYWPAVATVYVNVSPTIVEEYVTDDKGNPSLVSNKRSVYVYDSLSDFPVVGRTDLLYIAKDTSTQYYWDGSSYVSVTPSFTETDPVWTADKPSYLTSASAASTYAPISHTHTFASLTSVPTTLAGYGITDAYPLSGNPAGYLTSSSLTGYVPYTGANANLIMGTNCIGINSTDFGSGGHTFQLSVGGNILADQVYCNTFRDSTNSNTWVALTGSSPNQALTFGNGGVSSIYTPYGSFGIGLSSGVNARLHVRGSSAVSGTALLIQNSTPTDLFTVDNTGKIGLRPTNFELWFGAIGNASYANLKQVSGVLTLQAPNNSSTINLNGGIIGDYLTGANVYGVNITNTVNTRTITGTYSLLRLFQYIPPTSGISNTNFLEISGTINQTGGANGVTRGVLIAPTLTAAADFRGLEIITGNNAAHTLIKLNNGAQDVFCVKGDKTIIMNIPTSSAGLPSGALWNDSGTLKIV